MRLSENRTWNTQGRGRNASGGRGTGTGSRQVLGLAQREMIQGTAGQAQVWKSQRQEAGQAPSLVFKNPEADSGELIFKDSSLAAESGEGREEGQSKRLRMEPDTDSGCIEQRLFLDFLSKIELSVSV